MEEQHPITKHALQNSPETDTNGLNSKKIRYSTKPTSTIEYKNIISENILQPLKENINKKIIINLRSNKKLIGTLIKFDKHFNLILINAIEIFKVKNKNSSIEQKLIYKERQIKKILVRGDNVISISLI
ncbi:Small nuclear ribonucleoprotein [Spraguea lophii 42_110]|uniref:Small nuclear ribonucleoprotein Sm D2 n=1 Tax=Spraguea lophii (strain 42_110) TaxID=1358809 RepID=S7W981_SPRLO|nr:Small nuclear ribonucleoprotein [Spraguea lophii 42_110]